VRSLTPWPDLIRPPTSSFALKTAAVKDVDARNKPTAVRFSESSCNNVFNCNQRYPVAGLDPATHVFFYAKSTGNEDVDDRVKPGQGDFWGREAGKMSESKPKNLNRTAVGLSRPSSILRREAPEDVDAWHEAGHDGNVCVNN